jgi:hypothetical protein
MKATNASFLLGGKLGDTQNRVVTVRCVQECTVADKWVALADNLESSRSICRPNNFVLLTRVGIAELKNFLTSLTLAVEAGSASLVVSTAIHNFSARACYLAKRRSTSVSIR